MVGYSIPPFQSDDCVLEFDPAGGFALLRMFFVGKKSLDTLNARFLSSRKQVSDFDLRLR